MKVSIIIPTYNVEKYIVQCVKSVIEQSYSNIEVVCIDNESTDATFSILSKLKTKFDFKLATAKNIYPYCWDEAKDKGMELMSGDWFTVMGSDDYLDKDYVAKTIEFINRNPSVLALQSPMIGFHPNGQTSSHQQQYGSLEEFKDQCLSKSPVNTPTVFYHRSLHEKSFVFGKPELYSGAADYNLYCELADAGVYIHLMEEWAGYFYRWHQNQATWSMVNNPIRYDMLIQKFWRERWKTKK